jgi:hypothetical protein
MPTFSLAGQLRLQPTWTDTLSTTDVVDSVEIIRALTLANGTAAGQANAYWRDVRTVAGGASDSIAMVAGLPVSAFGGSSNLQMDHQNLKLLYVRNLSATVQMSLVLIDAEALPLPPSGLLLLSWPSGAQIGGANGGDFFVNNDGVASAQYEIILIGVKAT